LDLDQCWVTAAQVDMVYVEYPAYQEDRSLQLVLS
jgi:hypothetical protein